jgi:hypothetical protein
LTPAQAANESNDGGRLHEAKVMNERHDADSAQRGHTSQSSDGK